MQLHPTRIVYLLMPIVRSKSTTDGVCCIGLLGSAKYIPVTIRLCGFSLVHPTKDELSQ